jgi:hypothetical protein
VHDDERAGARAVAGRVGLHLGGVQHGEVGRERRELLGGGADEHVAHEVGVPRVGQHVAHAQPVRRVGAAVQVLHEQLGQRAEVRPHVGEQGVEVRLGHRLVDPAPVHVRLARRLAHDELVVGRAARVRRGHAHERPHVGQDALAAAHGGLHERRGDVVPVHLAGGRDAERGERARVGAVVADERLGGVRALRVGLRDGGHRVRK